MFSRELGFMSLSKTSKDILLTSKMSSKTLIFSPPLPKSRRGTWFCASFHSWMTLNWEIIRYIFLLFWLEHWSQIFRWFVKVGEGISVNLQCQESWKFYIVSDLYSFTLFHYFYLWLWPLFCLLLLLHGFVLLEIIASANKNRLICGTLMRF